MFINFSPKKSQYLMLFFLLISLTACTTITNKPATPAVMAQSNSAWRAQQKQISSLSSWTMRGRIAVEMAQHGGSASVFWNQKENNYSIELFGPLGAGAVYLNGAPGQIVLTSSKGERLQATTPEILLRKELGWNLPVTNLNYWIRGIPVSGEAKQTSFNNQGQLSQLQQDGWAINYLTYTTVNNLTMPQQLMLVGQGLTIKIIIDSWEVG